MGNKLGERGYMRMIWENNKCGIASEASVAIPYKTEINYKIIL